jgi:hypothetical protein
MAMIEAGREGLALFGLLPLHGAVYKIRVNGGSKMRGSRTTLGILLVASYV